jgi:hypothetical protein
MLCQFVGGLPGANSADAGEVALAEHRATAAMLARSAELMGAEDIR